MLLQKKTDAEILASVEPLMDNIIESSTNIDYEAHLRDFSERIKDHITKEGFEKVCQDYQSDLGMLTSREVVRIYRRPDSIAVIWVQKFSKCDGEYVAEMVVKEEDDAVKIDHVFIF